MPKGNILQLPNSKLFQGKRHFSTSKEVGTICVMWGNPQQGQSCGGTAHKGQWTTTYWSPGWHGPLLPKACEKGRSGHDAGCRESRGDLTSPNMTISYPNIFQRKPPRVKTFLRYWQVCFINMKTITKPRQQQVGTASMRTGLNKSKRLESGHPLPLRRFLTENKRNQKKKVKWKSSQLKSAVKRTGWWGRSNQVGPSSNS